MFRDAKSVGREPFVYLAGSALGRIARGKGIAVTPDGVERERAPCALLRGRMGRAVEGRPVKELRCRGVGGDGTRRLRQASGTFHEEGAPPRALTDVTLLPKCRVDSGVDLFALLRSSRLERCLVAFVPRGAHGGLVQIYYSGQTYYALEASREIDNPDQRIAEDVRAFTQVSLEFLITILTSLIDLASFSTILYS